MAVRYQKGDQDDHDETLLTLSSSQNTVAGFETSEHQLIPFKPNNLLELKLRQEFVGEEKIMVVSDWWVPESPELRRDVVCLCLENIVCAACV